MRVIELLPRCFFVLPFVLILQGCGVSKTASVPATVSTSPSAPPTATPPSTPVAPPPASKVVVFIGDSVTMLWGQQASFTAHTDWVNKGVSGQGSNTIAQRFQADVVALHPDEVHIVAGTNDVYPKWSLCNIAVDPATATTPPGVGDPTTAPDICTNMLYMVETAKRNNIKVIIGTIPPWACADDPYCGASVADETSSRYDRIVQLNGWLTQFAASEKIDIIDYHTALTNADGLHYATGLTEDGVHPDAAGYAIMQPLVEAKLK